MCVITSARPRRSEFATSFRRSRAQPPRSGWFQTTSGVPARDRPAARDAFEIEANEMVFLVFGSLRFWGEVRLLHASFCLHVCRTNGRC